MKNKIEKIFTEYGYLFIEAVDPDHPDFLEYLSENDIKIERTNKTSFTAEIIKLEGCKSDILKAVKEYWSNHDDDIKSIMSSFILY